MIQSLGANINSLALPCNPRWSFLYVKDTGRFPFSKNFGNSACPKTRPKPPRVWLQNTKERYWGQQFCQMERDISVRPTEITGPVKEDHLQNWSRIFRKWSVPFDVPSDISGILGWMESAHWIHTTVCCKVGDPVFALWPCFRPCLVLEDTSFSLMGVGGQLVQTIQVV